ncbi:transposon Tf2-1 polyprotein-like isoform X1, partial [Leptotrombidium deliense]
MFISRATTEAEMKYHATELELLCVVWAIVRLRMFLYGNEFLLVTDCEAVRQGLQKRYMVPRIARYVLQLQEFNFKVVHRPGRLMEHVDSLSRNAVKTDEVTDNFEARFDVYAINIESDWIIVAQQKDDFCQTLMTAITQRTSGTGLTAEGRFSLTNGHIYKVEKGQPKRLVVPFALRRKLITDTHEKYGHPAVDATMDALQQRYWFPGMRRSVKTVLGTCIECLARKDPGGKKPGFMNIIQRKKQPFNTLHIDHLGPLPRSSHGHIHILVAVCNFSKMVFLRAVTTTAAKQTVKAVNSIIEQLWIPERIVADRGTAFKNATFEEYCNNLQIKLIFNSTANPRANGQVERINRILVPLIAGFCKSKEFKDWDQQLPLAAIALNSRINKSTGKTPMEILYG